MDTPEPMHIQAAAACPLHWQLVLGCWSVLPWDTTPDTMDTIGMVTARVTCTRCNAHLDLWCLNWIIFLHVSILFSLLILALNFYITTNENFHVAGAKHVEASTTKLRSGGWTGGCQSCVSSYGASSCNVLLSPQLDAARDDLMSTGFVPSQISWPLVVNVTHVAGDDFRPSAICPPQDPDAKSAPRLNSPPTA